MHPCTAQESLSNLLLFNKLDKFVQQKIVADTYERTIPAGEILIQQGDTGAAAAQLYVVKSGKFEVSKTLLGFLAIPMLVVHIMLSSSCCLVDQLHVHQLPALLSQR